MKSRVALLAGVLAVAVVLFYALRGNSNSDTKPSTVESTPNASPGGTTRAARSAPTPSNAGADLAVKTDDVEHANTVGLVEPLEAGYVAVERAAKTCYRGRPAATPIRPNGPDETIETLHLGYRQVSTNGVGRIENLKVLHGQLTDQALQSCIVKAAATATWVSTAPDGEIGDLEHNLNLGNLMRPDGLPPESQRSPKPTAPPPPELAGPLGQQPPDVEDDHPGVVVSEPGLAKQPK